MVHPKPCSAFATNQYPRDDAAKCKSGSVECVGCVLCHHVHPGKTLTEKTQPGFAATCTSASVSTSAQNDTAATGPTQHHSAHEACGMAPCARPTSPCDSIFARPTPVQCHHKSICVQSSTIYVHQRHQHVHRGQHHQQQHPSARARPSLPCAHHRLHQGLGTRHGRGVYPRG